MRSRRGGLASVLVAFVLAGTGCHSGGGQELQFIATYGSFGALDAFEALTDGIAEPTPYCFVTADPDETAEVFMQLRMGSPAPPSVRVAHLGYFMSGHDEQLIPSIDETGNGLRVTLKKTPPGQVVDMDLHPGTHVWGGPVETERPLIVSFITGANNASVSVTCTEGPPSAASATQPQRG